MAISQVSSYAPSNTDPTNLMETVDDTRIGLHEVTLTEYTTTTVPAVAIGSVIEVGGTLFKAGTNQAISGSPSDGTVYIYMVPSGVSPNQILTPTFTNTAPTWSDSKQGWYDATGTYRYLHFYMSKSGASYTKLSYPFKKNVNAAVGANGSFNSNGGFYGNLTGDVTGGIVETGSSVVMNVKVIAIGDWNMDTTYDAAVAHGLTLSKIRTFYVSIINDAGTTSASLDVGGGAQAEAVNIYMTRIAAGLFDNTNYDSTSYNRGYVTIWYTD